MNHVSACNCVYFIHRGLYLMQECVYICNSRYTSNLIQVIFSAIFQFAQNNTAFIAWPGSKVTGEKPHCRSFAIAHANMMLNFIQINAIVIRCVLCTTHVLVMNRSYIL